MKQNENENENERTQVETFCIIIGFVILLYLL